MYSPIAIAQVYRPWREITLSEHRNDFGPEYLCNIKINTIFRIRFSNIVLTNIKKYKKNIKVRHIR